MYYFLSLRNNPIVKGLWKGSMYFCSQENCLLGFSYSLKGFLRFWSYLSPKICFCYRFPRFCFTFVLRFAKRSWQGCLWGPYRESLFTIFVSLASAIQFLMELKINLFWILKGHSTINSANEYEPDVLNPFWAIRV